MRKYHVALSFAGEQRNFIREVANKLKEKQLKVFFDEHDQSKGWGCEPYDYFGQIYSKEAYLVVLFISKEYIVYKQDKRHFFRDQDVFPPRFSWFF